MYTYIMWNLNDNFSFLLYNNLKSDKCNIVTLTHTQNKRNKNVKIFYIVLSMYVADLLEN